MMAVVSSHILDSVSGGSAAGIRCELFRLAADSSKQMVFDVIADAEGRISQAVVVDDFAIGDEFELVMHAAGYFGAEKTVVPTVVIRFVIDDADKRYHLPVMLAPHSYSTWWSS
jgi:5-hydroxyisourate hydrolase